MNIDHFTEYRIKYYIEYDAKQEKLQSEKDPNCTEIIFNKQKTTLNICSFDIFDYKLIKNHLFDFYLILDDDIFCRFRIIKKQNMRDRKYYIIDKIILSEESCLSRRNKIEILFIKNLFGLFKTDVIYWDKRLNIEDVENIYRKNQIVVQKSIPIQLSLTEEYIKKDIYISKTNDKFDSYIEYSIYESNLSSVFDIDHPILSCNNNKNILLSFNLINRFNQFFCMYHIIATKDMYIIIDRIYKVNINISQKKDLEYYLIQKLMDNKNVLYHKKIQFKYLNKYNLSTFNIDSNYDKLSLTIRK